MLQKLLFDRVKYIQVVKYLKSLRKFSSKRNTIRHLDEIIQIHNSAFKLQGKGPAPWSPSHLCHYIQQ